MPTETMTKRDYDLLVIGGGTAGLVSASGAAYLGARVALVEKSALGGDCLWTGCVPSKAMLASAHTAAHIREAGQLGLPTLEVEPSFRRVMERTREARAQVALHDDPDLIRARGIDVQFGAARFLAPGRVDVEGVGTLASKRIVVATGARPAIPPIPGLEEAGYLTHETVFDESENPGTVLILGAGPIGLEFAQIFSRLGVPVTVVERLPEILSGEDPEAAALLRSILEAEGVTFQLGEGAMKVEVEGNLKTVETSEGKRFTAETLFVATGRAPNTEGLELASAGIQCEGRAVLVNPQLGTTAKGVWAAGDVTGGPQFTHAADLMARTVVRNALLPLSARADLSNIPRVTYTDPEVAHVGLSHDDARANGGVTHRYEFSNLDRAITDGARQGFTKVTADRKGRILAATIVAKGAGELLMPLVLARTHGLSLADISQTVFPYPTMAEGVKRTADAYQRSRLEGRGGQLLRRVVSWLL